MRLFIALMLVSFNLFATVEWNDIERQQDIKLTQSFQLKQKFGSHSMVEITKGSEFFVKDIIGLEMVNVVLFQLEYKKCPGPDMATEMEIIPVNNTSPVVEIGAQLENCTLEIFIESRDLMSPSFFE